MLPKIIFALYLFTAFSIAGAWDYQDQAQKQAFIAKHSQSTIIHIQQNLNKRKVKFND